MRKINVNKIREAVEALCLLANTTLRPDVLRALKIAACREKTRSGKRILDVIIENARIARSEKLAICQDTGLPCVFVEIGQDVRVVNGSINEAIQQAVSSGYKRASFRPSIVNPLLRGKPGYSPCLIHTEIIKGDKIKISILPKGFGCENKSQLKMFNPTVSPREIKKFIINVVTQAGPEACPPFVVGVGIGGSADYALFLAKKALLKKINLKKASVESKLERELLEDINKLNIGPMGLGGKTTALAVNVLTHSTHIAGLPVAINISCHALRSATKII